MKLLPCARKMSATSRVGRLILPFSVEGWALRLAPKWQELRWGYSHLASVVESGEGRWSSLQGRGDQVELGSSSDRFRVPTDESPSCGAASVETPFSGYPHVAPLRGRRSRRFLK